MIVSWRVCACKGRSESQRVERSEDLRAARRPCGVLDLLLLLGCPIALSLVFLAAVLCSAAGIGKRARTCTLSTQRTVSPAHC